MANALTDLLDDEDLHASARNFKKSAGTIKKTSKSIVKAAKGNIFEFPVFVANSVPLDYATATVSLLEQVYASYLQMAISINPIIDDKTAREGSQFDHLKSDTSKYLECVDPTDMPYAFDACHSVYTENGIVAEFNLVNIEDTTARIINEAMDHEPLSEFDHFFSETYSGDGAGFFEGCTWIQEDAKADQDLIDKLNSSKPDFTAPVDTKEGQSQRKSTSTGHNGDVSREIYDRDTQQVITLNKSDHSDPYEDIVTTELSPLDIKVKQAQLWKSMVDGEIAIRGLQSQALNDSLTKEKKKQIEEQIKNIRQENKINEERLSQLQREGEWQYTDHLLKVNIEKAELSKLSKESEILQDKIDHLEDDRKRQDLKDAVDIENKIAATGKANSEIAKNKREDQWAREDRELDKMKKLNDARMKTPQMLDETKIQKLNTMKPLMMSVDLNVVDDNGSLSRPVSYVIGVKCHTRLIESNILPEVAAYPLKEMNNKLRKIKWRSGELKFGKDLLWKIGSKKQTAVDSHDKKRKWYRRLYELSHMSGDGLAAASVKNGKSPWANWWQDKLTGGYNKNVGHGLIPNATIVMSKSDVDNIKREKDIDLLSGSKAAKFCKELFLIGLVVIDDDAESVKVLLPDLHEDYDVMSIAAVKKQLAQLDTAGNKTRDIMKLLG